MKLAYQSPEMDVISLATIQETMQSASATGTSTDLSDPNIIAGDWDALFF